MQRLPYLLLAVLPAFFVLSCDDPDPGSLRPTDGPRYVVPEAGPGIVLASNAPSSLSIGTPEDRVQPGVRLSDDVLVSQVLEVNLDVDQADEQIVVFKRRDDPSDRIRVLIADFDTIRNAYIPSWEGPTQATNVRTFAVYTDDLTGDHNPEIMAFGMDSDGMQTLDVFRRSSSPTGIGLFFQPIGSFRSDGSIEIEEADRSQAYHTVQTLGTSYSVAVYSRNLESENVLDLLKTTHHWSFPEGSYIEGETEEIPGAQIEEQRLSSLYQGSVEDFEGFLSGPWYLALNDDSRQVGDLVFFDTQRRRVVFYRPDAQESYLWNDSHKTLYRAGPGLWLNIANESFRALRKQMSIAVLTANSLFVTFTEDDEWSGTYRRLTPSLQQSFLNNERLVSARNVPDLQGVFANDSGAEMFLASPRFVLREDGQELSGGFALFRVPDLIMELKVLNEDGLVQQRRTYSVELTEQTRGEQILRRLTLTPVTLEIRGVRTLPQDSIILEQVEQIEEEETAEGASQSPSAPS